MQDLYGFDAGQRITIPLAGKQIDFTVAGDTVTGEFPEIVPRVAVIVAEPAAAPLAVPEPSIVTTDGDDEVHVTIFVRSFVLVSE